MLPTMTKQIAALLAAVAMACTSERASEVAAAVPAPVAPPAPQPAPPERPLDPVAESIAIAQAGMDMGPDRLGSLMRDIPAGQRCTQAMTVNFARVKALLERLRIAHEDDELANQARRQAHKLYDCVNCARGAENKCAEIKVALSK